MFAFALVHSVLGHLRPMISSTYGDDFPIFQSLKCLNFAKLSVITFVGTRRPNTTNTSSDHGYRDRFRTQTRASNLLGNRRHGLSVGTRVCNNYQQPVIDLC